MNNRGWHWVKLVPLTLVTLCFACASRPADSAHPTASPITPAPAEPVDSYDLNLPGPTTMARVEGGYELKNRAIRLVISEQNGNPVYWGTADGATNVLGEGGIAAQLGQSPAALSGYVEKRDDETWQFIGEEPGRFRWRKVYCLSGESLFVTYLVENLTGEPTATAINLAADLPGFTLAHQQQPDLLEGRTPGGLIRMQAFVEHAEEAATSAQAATLRSDSRTLKPGERLNFTMEWRLSPAAATTVPAN